MAEPAVSTPAARRPSAPGSRLVWKSLPWLVALALALGLQIWFPKVDSGRLNDTWNVDVGGRNALYRFADRRFGSVTRSTKPLPRLMADLPPDSVVCILGPARNPTAREWESLIQWIARGGRVLYAARWESPDVQIPVVGLGVTATTGTRPGLLGGWPPSGGKPSPSPVNDKPPGVTPPQDLDKPGGVAPAAPPRVPSKTDSADASTAAVTQKPLLTLSGTSWESTGRIDGSDAELLLGGTGNRQAVRKSYGLGTLVVVASDNIFSNRSLYDRQTKNGVLASRLLEAAGARQGSHVVFDESLNATGTPRVVGLLLAPLLRPITVQIALLLILFAWSGSFRFGTALPPALPARHNVTDHTNALGNLYWRSGNGIVPISSYHEQLLADLRLGVRRGKATRSLESVASRAHMPVDDVRRLLEVAGEACDRNEVSRRDAATLIRRLSRLRERRGSAD